ncbi:MAG: hypothetical protein Q4F11_06010 [Eubacteriales bacterium]|nr:hypothetical protein [Eubacteriales bacterium]
MKAVKGNREYDIVTDADKTYYQNKGFDIVEADGTIIAYGKGRTVPYAKYASLKAELDTLKAGKREPDELSGMTVDELKAYAEANGIDIGAASTAEGILKKIKAAGKE